MSDIMIEDKEIHLRDYLKIIKKRRAIIYTFFIIIFTIILIVTLSSTPVYKASTKILIEKGETVELTGNPYTQYDPSFYETQYQLIKSASVAEKVVQMLSLEEHYDDYFNNKNSTLLSDIKEWLLKKIFGKNTSDDKEENKKDKKEFLIKLIKEGIIVKPVKMSKIVEISYLSTNPKFAAAVVNTVSKAYINEILEMKMQSSKYTLKWLTEKAEEERKKLQHAEEALQQYMRNNDIVTLENKVTIIPQKLTELSKQLTKAETKRKEIESLYNKIKKIRNLNKAETISAISSDPTIQALREEILKAEQNIIELSKKYGKKHPKMIRAISELNILKEKKIQEIKRVIESIKNEYELAKTNEMNLRKLLKKTKNEALTLNEKFIQYSVLKREVETNRKLYDVLIKKLKEKSITENIQTVNVWIVEKAKVPKIPVKPKKTLNILLGIIIGIFGGIGIAFFVEYLDNTIKSPEETENKLGVPVVGLISYLANDRVENSVLNEPKSAFAEDFKVLRTSILLSSTEKLPKSILITSASPEEGKTVTASNLAITIAQSEYSVLLLDADLRKPMLHKIFNLDNSKGLSTYLAGTSDLNIIQEGPLPMMSIIPSGPIPPNPSELLSSNKTQKLLELLKKRYDIIILDSPPLIGVSDSLILSKFTSGTLIITKFAKTTYDILSRCIKSLKDINANLFGIVINAVDQKKSDYYYYSNYYYQEPEDEHNINKKHND